MPLSAHRRATRFAVALLLGTTLQLPVVVPASAEVPLGQVLPKTAPPGAHIRIQVEGCSGIRPP